MKKYFFAIAVFLILIVTIFLPFGEYNLSGGDDNEIISLFKELKHISSDRDYVNPVFDTKIIVFIIVFLLLAISFVIISLFYAKKNHKSLGYISILPLFIFFILISVYSHVILANITPKFIPSWSFYLSLLLLIGWIAYLFSPKWFPRLKKAFAGFRYKHPTKAERIAELEREVNQLKSQDESTDISSHSDSNEKTSD